MRYAALTNIATESKGAIAARGVGILQLTTGAATAHKAPETRAKAIALWDAVDAKMKVEI